MKLRGALVGIVILLFADFVIADDKKSSEPCAEIVLAAEINWQQLNPARGDKSPKAGTLWGDRNGVSATGFLVKFVDGFESPPHIHNVAYRGMVISGLIHNDDPGAEKMWMRSGSFWTQPAGENHITAASGVNAVAYIEIEQGPYLVFSAEKKFNSGEKPINVDASNIVWIEPYRNSKSHAQPAIAYLWGQPGDGQLYGMLVKLPAGYTGAVRSNGSIFRAILITGASQYQYADNFDSILLEPGSYVGAKNKLAHRFSTKQESIIYVRTNGKLDFASQ